MFSKLKKLFGKWIPQQEIVFNIDSFNYWFCDVDNGAEYANKGIYLRVDKLSISQIEDYINKVFPNVKYATYYKNIDKLSNEFFYIVRQNWMDQLKHSNKE